VKKQTAKNEVPSGNWNRNVTTSAQRAAGLYKREGRRLDPAAVAKQVDELLAGKQFPAAAVAAGLKPSRRQARKFLRKKGLAYTSLQSRAA
jgi:tyrosyl-tRNA synthetase